MTRFTLLSWVGEQTPPLRRAKLTKTIKYIDPSYMIRSVPANAADAVYCLMLAQNAVHAAMAGFTQKQETSIVAWITPPPVVSFAIQRRPNRTTAFTILLLK